MAHSLVKACLDALSAAESDEAAWKVVRRYRRDLIADPTIGVELAAMVADTDDVQYLTAELMLLETVIEEAQMNRENAGSRGAAFLSTLDGAIARLGSNGAITDVGTYLLGRCYVRAGVEAPKHLKRTGATEGTETATSADLPDLDESCSASCARRLRATPMPCTRH